MQRWGSEPSWRRRCVLRERERHYQPQICFAVMRQAHAPGAEKHALRGNAMCAHVRIAHGGSVWDEDVRMPLAYSSEQHCLVPTPPSDAGTTLMSLDIRPRTTREAARQRQRPPMLACGLPPTAITTMRSARIARWAIKHRWSSSVPGSRPAIIGRS